MLYYQLVKISSRIEFENFHFLRLFRFAKAFEIHFQEMSRWDNQGTRFILLYLSPESFDLIKAIKRKRQLNETKSLPFFYRLLFLTTVSKKRDIKTEMNKNQIIDEKA